MKRRTDYQQLEASSAENRRLLSEEELILDVTIKLCEAIDSQGVARAALAERLGKSPSFVTQILSGGRNLTLRTIADVADALEMKARLVLCDSTAATENHTPLGLIQQLEWSKGEPKHWLAGSDSVPKVGSARMDEVAA